jgi:hypothetical protein
MIVLDGRLDIVLEWRKDNWSARAYGVTFKQWFFGFVFFKKIKDNEPKEDENK